MVVEKGGVGPFFSDTKQKPTLQDKVVEAAEVKWGCRVLKNPNLALGTGMARFVATERAISHDIFSEWFRFEGLVNYSKPRRRGSF